MHLINRDTKIPVKVGDKLLTFRGEHCTLTSVEEPTNPGSTGRVHVSFDDEATTHSFYPSVVHLEWRE
jgi:hypothetical protein